MKMFRTALPSSYLLLGSIAAFFAGCSDEKLSSPKPSATAALTAARVEPQLLMSPRAEGAGHFDYIALFPAPGAQGKIIGLSMVDCADEKAASALLGINPKKVLNQTFADYKKDPGHASAELFDAAKAIAMGIAEAPRLSCDPTARGATFKPFIQDDYSKIFLSLNEQTGTYLSLPVSCKGLNRGLDVPRLMKGKRPVDLKKTVTELAVKDEVILSCGRFKAPDAPPPPTWDLIHVRELPPRLFVIETHDPAHPQAIEIKRIDRFIPDDLLFAEVNPDGSEESKTWEAMKARLGIQTPTIYDPGTMIPGVLPNLVLDLCVRNCVGFNPEHSLLVKSETQPEESETRTVDRLTLLSDRDITGQAYRKWQYGADETEALVFETCGDEGLDRLLGLKEVSSDWTAGQKSNSEWLYAASKALKPGVNRSPLSCFLVSSKACIKEIKNKRADESWAQFLSIRNCAQQNRALITSLEIHISPRTPLLHDKQTMEITDTSLKAGFQSPVNKLVFIGDEPNQNSKIQRKVDCTKILCTVAQQGPMPAFRFSGNIAVELRNLSIVRSSAPESGSTLSALEVNAGAQLLLKDVKIGEQKPDVQQFDVGVRVLGDATNKTPTTANFIDTDIIARDINIQTIGARALIYASKAQTHFLAPVLLTKGASGSFATPELDDTNPEPVPMTANIALGGQGAVYVENQSLAGHRGIDAAGPSLVEANEVSFIGISKTERKTRLLYQKGGDGAIARITGGTIKYYDQLLYLEGDGSRFVLFNPNFFQLNECALDNSAFEPILHVGGLEQSSLSNIQFTFRDISSCGAQP